MPMRSIRPAAYAAAILVLATPGIVRAACPLAEKTVAGTTVDEANRPLSGVTVTGTWKEKAATAVSSQTKSDADGRFALLIQYSTYSGKSFGGGDRCEAPAPAVDITAALDAGPTTRERVELGAELPAMKLVIRQ